MEQREALADAVEATAHGYAMLLIDGEYGEGPEAVDAAAAKAIASAPASQPAGRHYGPQRAQHKQTVSQRCRG